MDTAKNTDPQAPVTLERILNKLRVKVLDRQYCDIGPYAGAWRVHVGTLYLTDDELRAVLDL
ncbi:hypothetical protein M8542_36290 [Amycolatopsis sp. OK19-0408]|uniref:Uncharacterized protein n=1 Tax=Amycolatopsis iheyensis TaxID=2945988 RepID=A0A9X2SQA7_9PSEU|nr:hypothetical protein [Amycolatopsis iheyensis]MCR6488305.1 hypothetical protein [Amycolatopsis iheyensis]